MRIGIKAKRALEDFGARTITELARRIGYSRGAVTTALNSGHCGARLRRVLDDERRAVAARLIRQHTREIARLRGKGKGGAK